MNYYHGQFNSFIRTNKNKNVIHTFPMANKPLSNNNKTPRNTNAIPKPAKPTPISVNGTTIIFYLH